MHYSKEKLWVKIRMKRYTDINTRKNILALHNEGYNQREIAKRLYVSPSTVNLWLNRQGDLNSKKRTGRYRKTTSQQDNEIYLMSTRNPFLPATDINRQLQLQLSPQTIRNRLTERGLHNFKAPQKPFLHERALGQRQEFAENYRHWTVEKWENVCFADEKTFQSFGNGIMRVWRPKLSRWDLEEVKKKRVVTRFHESVISTQNRSGRFSINVWGCIGKINHLHLVKRKTLDKFYYRDVILNDYFPRDAEDFILAQDNAPVHTAKIVRRWLEENNITVLKWPPYSPDLNPIENLWGRMEYLTRNRNPTSKENLWEIVNEVYNEIIRDEDYIKKLVHTMPKRLEYVYNTDGKWTKF